MKTITKLFLSLILTLSFNAFAQLNTPRGSQLATVSQRVGITDNAVEYSRPSVNGREIWGKLVPYGMNNLGFGTAKESPWRAGANENTIITFSDDATVEGKPIKAGTYGLHLVINTDNTADVILSNNSTAWGSYFYNPEEDAVKVRVTMKDHPHTEQLTFNFENVTANSATVVLNWGKKQIPFNVGVDVTNIVLTDIRKKLQDQPGFNRQSWEQAAAFSSNNGGDLNEALSWIDAAISGQNFSQQTFANTQIKSGILMKLGKTEEAIALMDAFLPKATVFEAHQYGRLLINQKMADKALDVFKMNANKNKDAWPTQYGLARAYSAKGDYKKALGHLKMALNNAPNEASKGRVQANIEKLEKGQDIN